jgi:hypothetical protein
MLFRVEWSVGASVGDAAAYAALVQALLPGLEVRTTVLQNEHCVPMEGAELFIGAAKAWRGEFRQVASGGRAARIDTVLSTGCDVVAVPGGPIRKDAVGRLTDGYLRDPASGIVDDGRGPRMLDVAEAAAIFGIERAELPEDTAAAFRALGRAVPIKSAERAIRGLNNSAELS